MKKTNAIVLVVVLVISTALVSLLVVQSKKPGPYDSFAQCLSDSGAKFYGAWWCPHCQAQKALFGRSAKLLPYVECSEKGQGQTKECDALGIQGYPTWIFSDGSRKSGEIPLSELSQKTNCPIQ